MSFAPSIVVHGGAGEHTTQASLEAARVAVDEAARAGWDILRSGGSALDAAEATVRALEDAPALNAGRGSVLNAEGRIEVDASIMIGADLRAGAVGAVPNLRHPVTLARRVLEDGRHVLLVGDGALAMARAHGIDPEPPDALVVPRAVRRYVEALAAQRGAAQSGIEGGTVGAVAFDVHGQLVAATSTGGVAFKLPGRLGDTPIPGAGTYADDRAGAASATGHGENILRVLLTKRIVDALAGAEPPHPRDAAHAALAELRARTGGSAGVVVLDRAGRVGVAFNTVHMPHAFCEQGGTLRTGA